MIVGYTGFVGSNLCLSHDFQYRINSRNIETAFGLEPERLIYAGVPAEMFLANRDPERDRAIIENAEENIRRIGAKTVVLISTVAVYDRTREVDEDYEPEPAALAPYGRHRLELERWVEANCPRHLILRLPALYGENLKKNFLYDFLHRIPGLLAADKFAELSAREPLLASAYARQENGFYRRLPLEPEEEAALGEAFRRLDFSALNFTDEDSVYQFFWLKELYGRIEDCLARGLERVNLATPPVSVRELYFALTGEEFHNRTSKPPYYYDIRTKHAPGGYLMTKEQELDQLRAFVAAHLPEGGLP